MGIAPPLQPQPHRKKYPVNRQVAAIFSQHSGSLQALYPAPDIHPAGKPFLKPLFYMGQNAVELIQGIVVDHQATFASGTVLNGHRSTERIGQLILETTDIR